MANKTCLQISNRSVRGRRASLKQLCFKWLLWRPISSRKCPRTLLIHFRLLHPLFYRTFFRLWQRTCTSESFYSHYLFILLGHSPLHHHQCNDFLHLKLKKAMNTSAKIRNFRVFFFPFNPVWFFNLDIRISRYSLFIVLWCNVILNIPLLQDDFHKWLITVPLVLY